MGHAVQLGATGRLEVVRRAPPESETALRATVEVLRRAAGAGAVDVLDVEDAEAGLEVRIAYAGRAVGSGLDGPTAARIGAAVAAHLADLELRGIAHGALDPTHVLVANDGAVRLTGFVPGAVDHHADVLALGGLLRSMLDDDARDERADAVRAAAARCCADDPAARPTAAAIAAALATPREVRHAPPPRRRARHLDRRLMLAAGSAIVIVLAALVLWPRPSRPHPTRHTTAPTATVTTSTTVAPARVWPRSTTLVHDGARWQFDRDGIAALVGNFGCAGARAALLDHDGRLWVTSSMEDGAGTALVATIDSAVDAEVVRTEDRCDAVRVLTSYGTFRTIAA